MVCSPALIEQVKVAAAEQSREIRDKYEKLCEHEDVRVQTIAATGDAREHIMDAIKKLNIDMLVIASRGQSTLKRYHIAYLICSFMISRVFFCTMHAGFSWVVLARIV